MNWCINNYHQMKHISSKKTGEIIGKKINDRYMALDKNDFSCLSKNNKKVWRFIEKDVGYFVRANNNITLCGQTDCDYCGREITFTILFNFVDDFGTGLILYGLGFFCDRCFNEKIESCECGGYNIIDSMAKIDGANNWIVFRDYDDLPSSYNFDGIDKTKFHDEEIIMSTNNMEHIYQYLYGKHLNEYLQILFERKHLLDYIEVAG